MAQWNPGDEVTPVNLPDDEEQPTIGKPGLLTTVTAFATRTVTVVAAATPSSVDLAFTPAQYLAPLLSLAERYVRARDVATGPSASSLALRLFQPMDKLVLASNTAPATARVHQSRIAVEALRSALDIGTLTPTDFPGSVSEEIAEATPAGALTLADGDTATTFTASANAVNVTYRLRHPAIAATYKVQATDDAASAPKEWTLQGSADGQTWTTLNTQTAQTFTARQLRSYPIASPLPFAFYRLAVTANSGAASTTTKLSNWQLFIADRSAALPPEQEQSFRSTAYDALLRALGTSYTELRAARTAGTGVRKALADRLGLELGSARPDRLDALTIAPGEVTGDNLEKLFGYRNTQPSDPMTVPALIPDLLAGLRSGLRTVWRRADEAERDVSGAPRPLIDPDLISTANLRGTTTADKAFELYSSRRATISTDISTISSELTAGSGSLTSFDGVLQNQIPGPDLDFGKLAGNDAAGEDITAALAESGLSVAAFRFIAALREVYPAATPLASELADVTAILVQARKLATRYADWRAEERAAGLVLEPAVFAPDPAGTVFAPPAWRGETSASDAWRSTLDARTRQIAVLEARYQSVVEAAENQVLPRLRDALLAENGRPLGLSAAETADRLTRELCVDFRAADVLWTSRVTQAVNTMQSLLVAVRSGVFAGFADPKAQLSVPSSVNNYDVEWSWLKAYDQWLSASRTFAYPENQLEPALFRTEGALTPTTAFVNWIANEILPVRRLTPQDAQDKADRYLDAVRNEVTGIPDDLVLRSVRTSTDLTTHAAFQSTLIPASVTTEAGVPKHVREIYWLVPMALAAKLRESRQFTAALDWYRNVFNYQAPADSRAMYKGLTLEASITTSYARNADWLLSTNLNPHLIARNRQGTYTRATVRSIAECLVAFADSELVQGTADSGARAQSLYQSAVDLLALTEAAPPSSPASPFVANPVPAALSGAAQAGLAKISAGLNIAGSARPATSLLPSQYRYAVLIERAKALVATAQQVEAAYFAALERTDAETYSLLQAGHDLRVSEAQLTINDVKVAGADVGIELAELQRRKSQDLAGEMQRRINAGLNEYERSQLDHLRSAASADFLGGMLGAVGTIVSSGATGGALGVIGGLFSGAGHAASTIAQQEQSAAQIDALSAGYARRSEEWALQRSQANRDVAIGGQQISLARNQRELAVLERGVAQLNQEHAKSVATFLANKFTNVELYQWMSRVLGRVYDFLLQQATATAQLAEAQLAFERQEAPAGVIAADYWQDATADPGTPVDARGLTGSARLLADVTRLDQQAFTTDRRRLELTHTYSLNRIAGFELEQLRRTGVLTFATPQDLFDREFPGHYLRLVKSVQVSVVALIPPTRGIRATLEASGVSRAVIRRADLPGAPFETVTLRRDPEKIAFTAPIAATGLFAQQPANAGLLLPFEGMGVDAMWQLELPKAANPFDYGTIADVLLTIEYTALHNDDYRRDVVRRLGRRFAGDRGLSVRNEFPDVWYALNNPDLVDDRTARMTVVLPLTADDLPPHIEDLSVRELSLFVLWKDPDATSELTVTSVSHAGTTTGSATSTGGVISTRRSSGDAWHDLTGPQAAAEGEWRFQLPDTATVRSWFADGLIEDLVVVMSLAGRTPDWS